MFNRYLLLRKSFLPTKSPNLSFEESSGDLNSICFPVLEARRSTNCVASDWRCRWNRRHAKLSKITLEKDNLLGRSFPNKYACQVFRRWHRRWGAILIIKLVFWCLDRVSHQRINHLNPKIPLFGRSRTHARPKWNSFRSFLNKAILALRMILFAVWHYSSLKMEIIKFSETMAL